MTSLEKRNIAKEKAQESLPHDGFRSYPHANAAKKEYARTAADNEEAAEFLSTPFHSRKGGTHNIPDVYDDEPAAGAGKFKTKPKTKDKKGSATIRKTDISDEIDDV